MDTVRQCAICGAEGGLMTMALSYWNYSISVVFVCGDKDRTCVRDLSVTNIRNYLNEAKPIELSPETD